jgi:hypothetical protein
MGYLNAQNESEGYGRGHRFMPDVTMKWVAKMGHPLAPTSDGRADPLEAERALEAVADAPTAPQRPP